MSRHTTKRLEDRVEGWLQEHPLVYAWILAVAFSIIVCLFGLAFWMFAP